MSAPSTRSLETLDCEITKEGRNGENLTMARTEPIDGRDPIDGRVGPIQAWVKVSMLSISVVKKGGCDACGNKIYSVGRDNVSNQDTLLAGEVSVNRRVYSNNGGLDEGGSVSAREALLYPPGHITISRLGVILDRHVKLRIKERKCISLPRQT